MIAIIDYDMGNLKSVEKAFKAIGKDAVVTRSTRLIKDASRLVLPGVGAFKECMKNLERYGLIKIILDGIKKGKPFLGICLGLQLLFEESEEDGIHRGLGIIKGRVKRFPSERQRKVPHMGWNDIKIKKSSPLLNDIPDGSFFYFVHSYYAMPMDKGITLTTTDYGSEFTSAIAEDNVFACQFHPEKSQSIGLKMLKNFIDMND